MYTYTAMLKKRNELATKSIERYRAYFLGFSRWPFGYFFEKKKYILYRIYTNLLKKRAYGHLSKPKKFLKGISVRKRVSRLEDAAVYDFQPVVL